MLWATHAKGKQELRQDAWKSTVWGNRHSALTWAQGSRGRERGSAPPPEAVHILKRPLAVRKYLWVCLRSHRATAVTTPRRCSPGVPGGRNWNKCCHGLNPHVECWSQVLKYPEHLDFKGDTSLSGSAYPKCQGHKSCALGAIKTQKDTCILTKREHSGWS